jgi:hypothetical protein
VPGLTDLASVRRVASLLPDQTTFPLRSLSRSTLVVAAAAAAAEEMVGDVRLEENTRPRESLAGDFCVFLCSSSSFACQQPR